MRALVVTTLTILMSACMLMPGDELSPSEFCEDLIYTLCEKQCNMSERDCKRELRESMPPCNQWTESNACDSGDKWDGERASNCIHDLEDLVCGESIPRSCEERSICR